MYFNIYIIWVNILVQALFVKTDIRVTLRQFLFYVFVSIDGRSLAS
jgi:hypothetical protein